jgi:hypothetical protein
MEEGLKDIANFEGLYQVSNLGRVKSLPNGFNNSNITNCCRGRYKSMYGYKWKYKQ